MTGTWRPAPRMRVGLAAAVLTMGTTAGMLTVPPAASAAAVAGLPLPTTLTLDADQVATAPVPIPANVRDSSGVVKLAPQIAATAVSLPSGCDVVSLQIDIKDTDWGHMGFNALRAGQTETIHPSFPMDGTTTRTPVITLWETWTTPCAGAVVRITLWSTTCPTPTLVAVPGSTGLKVGRQVTAQGCGYSARKGPITLTWGSKRLAVLPARTSFSYTFTVRFPDAATKPSCAGVLAATQAGRTQRLTLTGTPKTYVFVARGVTRPGGGAVKDGEMLCDGDADVTLAAQHVWVVADRPTAARFLVVDSVVGTTRLRVPMIIFGSRGGVTLGVPGGRVTVLPEPGVGPTRRSAVGYSNQDDCAEFKHCGTLGPNVPGTVFDIDYYAPQPLRISGDVTLQNAFIYGAGAVTVAGGVQGLGWIVANGPLTVTGSVDLDEAPAPTGDGVSRSLLLGQDGVVLP